MKTIEPKDLLPLFEFPTKEQISSLCNNIKEILGSSKSASALDTGTNDLGAMVT